MLQCTALWTVYCPSGHCFKVSTHTRVPSFWKCLLLKASGKDIPVHCSLCAPRKTLGQWLRQAHPRLGSKFPISYCYFLQSVFPVGKLWTSWNPQLICRAGEWVTWRAIIQTSVDPLLLPNSRGWEGSLRASLPGIYNGKCGHFPARKEIFCIVVSSLRMYFLRKTHLEVWLFLSSECPGQIPS